MRVVDRCEEDIRALINHDWPSAAYHSSFDELFARWLTFKARSIVAIPRDVKLGSRVKRVLKRWPAIQGIISRLRRGVDVNIYLHKELRRNPEKESGDRLFLDWGLHHFHIGNVLPSGDIDRSQFVLFAYIDGATVHLLDVKDHSPSSNPLVWVDADLLRCLWQAAPALEAIYRLKGVVGLSREYTQAERLDLRNSGINTIVEVDGKYYCPPGGGSSSAHTRVSSLRFVDGFHDEKDALIKAFMGGKIRVPGLPNPPFVEPVAVLRVRFRDGALEIFEESSGTVFRQSKVVG